MAYKYRKKQPPEEEMRVYKEVCIRCGKSRLKQWPKILPIPNLTEYIGEPSRLQCLMGNHYYYAESELEKNV